MKGRVFELLGVCTGLALVAAVPGCASAPRMPDAPQVLPGAKLLPTRVRRLSNAEYERTVAEVLQMPVAFADRLPQDARQQGFTENSDQTVVAAWSTRLDAVIREVVKGALGRQLAVLSACKGTAEVCRSRWLDALGRRAYRRRLHAEERARLLAAFDEGARAGRGVEGGVELTLTALLEAPSTLYLSELGDGRQTGGAVTLTGEETASLLAYTVRGGPPDVQLLNAAEAGELASPARREAEARRLLAESDARYHFRRFVLEWLEVDGLGRTAKSVELYPDYDELRPKMLEETAGFVDEVMVHAGASVHALLDAGFATVDPTMARFYGMKTFGARANLAGTGRSGVLQQASFLAAHAHEDSTSPVKRGDFVLRKLLCDPVKRPQEVGIEVAIPPAAARQTTRERFSRHATDPNCAGCHQTMDAIGFTFEAFDAEGRRRERDADRPVDARARLVIDGQRLEFSSSAELSAWLSRQPRVSECFARHAFRFWSGQADPAVEASYLELLRTLPAELADNLIEQLVLYVKSDFFVKREARVP